MQSGSRAVRQSANEQGAVDKDIQAVEVLGSVEHGGNLLIANLPSTGVGGSEQEGRGQWGRGQEGAGKEAGGRRKLAGGQGAVTWHLAVSSEAVDGADNWQGGRVSIGGS